MSIFLMPSVHLISTSQTIYLHDAYVGAFTVIQFNIHQILGSVLNSNDSFSSLDCYHSDAFS